MLLSGEIKVHIMELLNYFSFPIQSNIYGLSCLQIDDGINRLLVATLEKQIFCIEKQNNKFSCREVHFTYIPSKKFFYFHSFLANALV